MRTQFGRSMVEMLGVLAIIGVLSIGGIALYRRAVNNHHANTILGDVNRFAFAIIEKGNYPLGRVIPKGDFKESGIYQLEGYQDAESNQYSITVADVPKGVCEPLLDKATVEYKVRVNQSANELGPLYDSLNTDLCRDNNIMVFYFGDTAGVCNVPDDDGPTPCTTNADCCGEEFCVYVNATNLDKLANGNGECQPLATPQWATLSDGQRWVRSREKMNFYSAQSWCAALGLRMTTRAELNCSGFTHSSTCEKSFVVPELKQIWSNPGPHWLNEAHTYTVDGEWTAASNVVELRNAAVAIDGRGLSDTTTTTYALCH